MRASRAAGYRRWASNMAIDAATFLTLFPEFKDAGTVLITAKLTQAQQYTPLCPWGKWQQEGTFLYAARFLALTPWGRKMNLANAAGQTNYDADLRRVQLIVSSGARVT